LSNQEPISYLTRALAIREQQLGPHHPGTANSLNNLALLYRDQGKYPEAEPLLQRALAICEQQLGASHPTTRIVRQNYTLLLQDFSPRNEKN
jgi:tetratricopeptide (TPR) repeat protein